MNDEHTYSALDINGPHSTISTNLASGQNLSLTENSIFTHCFRELNRMRMNGTLCNCVLTTTDGASFRVHKFVMALCSDYFQTLFSTSLVDKRCGDGQYARKFYHIPNVSSASLESIINFAYSGVVHVKEDNVNELLPAADQFNVEGIVRECIEFLLRNMKPENCIGIWRLGIEYFLPTLKEEATRFILEHFVNIINTEEFLDLKVNFLNDILENNALNVPDEFIVWIAIKRWCAHKYTERQKYISELFPSVRLALLSCDQLKVIMDDATVYRHERCRTYIHMATRYILSEFGDLQKDVQDKSVVPMFIPRYPHEVIFSYGGWTNSGPTNVFEIYDCRADMWKMMLADDFESRAYHQTLCYGDYVYIIGGSNDQDQLNSCWRCDITKFTFEEISPMREKRAFLSSAVLSGKIYAIGGYNGDRRLQSVEFYDPNQKQWTYITPMNEKRSDASASSLRNRIFVVGGFNGFDFLESAECYFAEFDQWFYLPAMMNFRSGAGCVAVDDAVYAIGGYDGENRLNSVEKYCLFQSQWFASKPMKQRRSNFAVTMLEKKIYVMGGYDDIADDTTEQSECFDPTFPEWRSIAPLTFARSGLSACTFSGISRITRYINDDRFRCLLKNVFKKDDSCTDRSESDETRSALQIV